MKIQPATNSGGGSAPPTGAAGGALTGTYPNPSLVAASEALPSTFTMTAATGVYQNVGLTIALPVAGTYFIYYKVRCVIFATALAWITAQLFNQTTSTAIAVSRGLFLTPSSTPFNDQGEVNLPGMIYSTTLPNEILSVQANRNGAYTTTQIASNIDGVTSLAYLRIS